MPRLSRLCPESIPQHIIQRGNNRQICFACDDDIAAYATWLKDYSQKYEVEIHAWVFMTNHVHLLVTPRIENGVSLMMQSLGRKYVCYFNRSYQRSGTLWEGRFKLCLVQSVDYLLRCYRYIELNPVRAGMVEDPAEYSWSSYQANALGEEIELLTAHEEYLKLGSNLEERLINYRALFCYDLGDEVLEEIRKSVNKGLALGGDKFKDEVEFTLKHRVRPLKAGRPKKKNYCLLD